MADLKSKWFVSTLSIAAGLFFAGALIVSGLNYVNVMDANESITLMNAVEGVEMLDNGTLMLTFEIQLDNPSRVELSIYSVSWTVAIENGSGTTRTIPVASTYAGSSQGSVVREKSVETYSMVAYVTDPAKLANIEGFINYSALNGQDYDFETVPYIHDFRVSGWMADFPHDYQTYRETYLNDMVKIELSYLDGEYS